MILASPRWTRALWIGLVAAGYSGCRDEASAETAAKFRALRAGLKLFMQSQARLPRDLAELCSTNLSWCAHQSPEQWLRDAWGSPIAYRSTATGYTLGSSGRDRRSGTRDDLVIEVDVESVRAAAIAGCYLLSATIPRLASDTLELLTRLASSGYAIQRPRSIDGSDVFIAEWRPTDGDGFVASWGRIHNGVRMTGRITNERLEARVDGRRISGRRINCSG